MALKKSKSKKLSSTKEFYQKQLEDTIFFVDRSSGKYELPNGLKALGLVVERHDDHFAANTLDLDWIGICGQRNWVIVSSDLNIKRNTLERLAIFGAKVAAFFFTSAQLTSQQQIDLFKRALPKIAKMLATQSRPFIARITKNGDVELWLNNKGEDLLLKRQKLKKRN